MNIFRIKMLFVPILLLAFHISGCSSGQDTDAPPQAQAQAQTQTCGGDAGVALVEVYAIAVSYPDSVPEFVQKNTPLFQQNGSAIKCGKALASQLLSAALSGPSPNSVREHAGEVACRAGRCDLGESVSDSILKDKSDMYQLGVYVQNLVDTAPNITEGDVDPYQNTAVYQTSQLVWSTTESMGVLHPSDIKVLRDLLFEVNKWYLGNFASLVP